ncbi:TPA: hypothetical protein ACGO3A_000262 [Streptococcus suis]
MECLQFRYDSYFNNVNLISALILEILKETTSSYIYVSNLVSYSKYKGEAKENIIKRQRLIDFNADTRFNHFTELTINEFFDYFYQCQYIEECRIILTNKHYTVEELYKNLEYENVVFELELIEEVLYSLKISEGANSVSLKNLSTSYDL